MVKFLQKDDDNGTQSRWKSIMNQTKQRLDEIWEGNEKLPDRDGEE